MGFSLSGLVSAGLPAGLSYLSGKKRGDAPSVQDFDWENTQKLKENLSSSLLGKIGKPTEYKYNEAFNIDQPDIEKQAETVLGNYLSNPTTNVSDYSESTKKYSEAAKASRAETYADEEKKTKDMYNRLGLVSSTPGLTAVGDLNRKQATEANLLDSELAYQNLDRTLKAQGLDVTQLSSILGQSLNLGGTQRASQKYSQQMSMSDLERQTQEEQANTQAILSYLGKGASTPGQQYSSSMTQWAQPNEWDYLSQIVTPSNISSILGG